MAQQAFDYSLIPAQHLKNRERRAGEMIAVIDRAWIDAELDPLGEHAELVLAELEGWDEGAWQRLAVLSGASNSYQPSIETQKLVKDEFGKRAESWRAANPPKNDRRVG